MFTSDERNLLLKAFCKKFGFKFKNIELLNLALTHSSFDGHNSYERLEFLGDSVLKLVVSGYLFNKYETENEGILTKMRAEIVSDKTLSRLASFINLQDYIVFGKNEEKNNFKENAMIKACAFEALLGALFLEYGNLKAVVKFLFKNFEEEFENLENSIDFLNPKATLQEFTQKNDHNLPEYKLLEVVGAEHKRQYRMAVYYNGEFLGEATANSKKEAEKLCAKEALLKLNIKIREAK